MLFPLNCDLLYQPQLVGPDRVHLLPLLSPLYLLLNPRPLNRREHLRVPVHRVQPPRLDQLLLLLYLIVQLLPKVLLLHELFLMRLHPVFCLLRLLVLNDLEPVTPACHVSVVD